MTRSEAARKGWETRHANIAKRQAELARVAALHAAEAAAHWARMPAETRETAVERGWGAHLPADLLATITKP